LVLFPDKPDALHSHAKIPPDFCGPGRASCGSDASRSPYSGYKIYADEVDVLNMALFGITAADWRKANPIISAFTAYFTASQTTAPFSNGALPIGQPAHRLSQFFTAQAFRR
jgi:hypothetical protein